MTSTDSALQILVVEDDPDSAYALTQLLKAYGYRVLTCRNGPEALDNLAHFRPEVAILDIGLPLGMDGFELGRRLRQRAGPNLKMFALTGMAREDARGRAESAGFDDVLFKPVDARSLFALTGAGRGPWPVGARQ